MIDRKLVRDAIRAATALARQERDQRIAHGYRSAFQNQKDIALAVKFVMPWVSVISDKPEKEFKVYRFASLTLGVNVDGVDPAKQVIDSVRKRLAARLTRREGFAVPEGWCLVARVSQSEWVEIPEFPAGFRWREWPPGTPDSCQIA